jgi:hydroxymethylbilane synthase
MRPIAAHSPRQLVIATRESRLALWQARHVQARLQALYPDCAVQLLGMTTRGDQILDRSLSKVGGKGLFVKELETALLDGRADLAVHSLKDVPVLMDEAFELAGVMRREDPRDAFVSVKYAHPDELPPGAVVGTSSLRREAQLRARYPRIELRSLRGNLDTRLAKLDQGEYQAIILACAGLTRLGLAHRIRCALDTELMLPAVGQGILGIEIAAGRPELHGWLAPLFDAEADACARAERAVSLALGGSCTMPIAAYATVSQGYITLRARLASPDGLECHAAHLSGPASEAEALGLELARRLLDQGAGPLLERLKQA